MKGILKDKKIVIIDVETSGFFCGEDGKKPANILRVDATKIENGKIGETFSSLVACNKKICGVITRITGIDNTMLKGAPRIKTVLNKFKKFIEGYEVYAMGSGFVNKFLSYYANKNNVTIKLANPEDYDEISRFLRYGNNLRETLKTVKDLETVILANLLVEKFL